MPAPVVDALKGALGQGGFGATRDNAYVTVSYTMRGGNLLLSARAPTYRRQHPAAANSLGRSGNELVRYWSLCSTQATRPVDCLRDERVVVDDDGFFRIIVAPACPVAGFPNCLRAGKATAAGNGSILYRNLLAVPRFSNELGPHRCPSSPSQFCGEYALTAHYLSRPQESS